MPPTGDVASSQGMDAQAGTESTEPPQPGLTFQILCIIVLVGIWSKIIIAYMYFLLDSAVNFILKLCM